MSHKRRLLVTGYGGFVAGSIVQQAGPDWDLFALARSHQQLDQDNLKTFQLDLRDTDRLRQVFLDVRPAALIHAAALADIDYCQVNQAEAQAVNVEVTQRLVELCRQCGTRMVYCSTDSIFDGARGRYVEADTPSPPNFYAETKVQAESIVREQLENWVIARLALVLGLPLLERGNSFLARMLASFQQGSPVQMPVNEIRTPIDVITLGRALLELAGGDFRGIVHLAGNSRLNRLELALEIAEHYGFPPDLVQPTNSNAMPGRAPRSDDASLDNSKAKQLLRTPMLSLAEALGLISEVAE